MYIKENVLPSIIAFIVLLSTMIAIYYPIFLSLISLTIGILGILSTFSTKTPLMKLIFGKQFPNEKKLSLFFSAYKEGIKWLAIFLAVLSLYLFLSFIQFKAVHQSFFSTLYILIIFSFLALILARNFELFVSFLNLAVIFSIMTSVIFGVGVIATKLVEAGKLDALFIHAKELSYKHDLSLQQAVNMKDYAHLYELDYIWSTKADMFINQHRFSRETFDFSSPVNWKFDSKRYVFNDDAFTRIDSKLPRELSRKLELLKGEYFLGYKELESNLTKITGKLITNKDLELIYQATLESPQVRLENITKITKKQYVESFNEPLAQEIDTFAINLVTHSLEKTSSTFISPKLLPRYWSALMFESNTYNFSNLAAMSKVLILNLKTLLMDKKVILLRVILLFLGLLASYSISLLIKNYNNKYDSSYSQNPTFFIVVSFFSFFFTLLTLQL